jgi:hypothetical protein
MAKINEELAGLSVGAGVDADGNKKQSPTIPTEHAITVGAGELTTSNTSVTANPTTPEGWTQPTPGNVPSVAPRPFGSPFVGESIQAILTPFVDDGLREYGGGIIHPDAEDTQEAAEPWDGDPEKEVLPGEFVYYWIPGNRPGLLMPHVMLVIGRTPAGAYTGLRFRPAHGAVFAVGAAMPSAYPARSCFTNRRRFTPEQCRDKT